MGERMMAGYIAIAAAAAVVCLVAIFAARRHYEKRMKETYRHLLETLTGPCRESEVTCGSTSPWTRP